MRTICCVFLFFFLCAGGYARKNTPAGQIFRTKPCLQSLTGRNYGQLADSCTGIQLGGIRYGYPGAGESPDDARRTGRL